MLFHHTDDVTEWLQALQWDESPLQVSDIMLDLPTPHYETEGQGQGQGGGDKDWGKGTGTGMGVGVGVGAGGVSSGDILGSGTSTPRGRAFTPGLSGAQIVLTEFPTPRSLVIAISGNIIRTMNAYSHVHDSADSRTKSDTSEPHPSESESSFQFSRSNIMDQGNSNISATTLKKLSKLSLLPQQRENLDFLSASFPYLDVKSDSPKLNQQQKADFEEEEDEI